MARISEHKGFGKSVLNLLFVLLIIFPPVAFAQEMEGLPASQSQGLSLKGVKLVTVRSRSVEGSKEGDPSGSILTREESLRLNISGSVEGTEVDATIISNSSAGTSATSSQQDKVSIMLRRASTEAYWGDFTANFDDVEFARLNKELSGFRVSGDYGVWGFKAIASSPKGEGKEARLYGDGTQGPYHLGFSPVVVNSEHILVDGIMQRRGEDYDVDYEGGTVTFRKRAIISTSVIQVGFDYRSTPYQRSTYGLRFVGEPSEGLCLGTTYINDSDSLSGAAEQRAAMTLAPIDPMSHYVVGLDGSYVHGPALRMESEFAYSDRNPDLLASKETVYKDSAFKLNTFSDSGPFYFATRLKRIGKNFQSIADAMPKQDLWLLGSDLRYRFSEGFCAEGTYDNESFLMGNVRYLNNFVKTKTMLAPAGWPALSHYFLNLEESNDPVSGAAIGRLTVRNALDAYYQYGFLSHIVSGSDEKRLNRTLSEEAIFYRTLSYGVSTLGLERITVAGNVELKETKRSYGDPAQTRTYVLNLSAAPAREYFASLNVNHVDDTLVGMTDVTDLSFRAAPIREANTEGKYTIMSVKEEFGATPEAVSKQLGSFRIDLRPIGELRLRHTYKPSFTLTQREGLLSYNNNSNQSEINWAPLRELSLGLIYRVDEMFSLDRAAILLRRQDERSSTRTNTYSIKAAPIPIMSIELNYSYQNIICSNLISSEPVLYEDAAGEGRIFDAALRTSLSERFSLDSRYTSDKQDNISTDPSEDIDMLTQTTSVKGTYNIDDSWSIYASTAYSETADNLDPANKMTYTLSPGAGFIYRLGSALRIDSSYTYSRSFAGSSTETALYSLKAKYDMNEYVHFSLDLDHEQSSQPFYKVTDFVGNIEIDL